MFVAALLLAIGFLVVAYPDVFGRNADVPAVQTTPTPNPRPRSSTNCWRPASP